MNKRYFVGDIHGCSHLLEELLNRIGVREQDEWVFLGDYINRGPDVKGVLDRLIKLSEQTNTVFLRGNHEQMLLDFIDNDDRLFLQNDSQLATINSVLGQKLLYYPYTQSIFDERMMDVTYSVRKLFPKDYLEFIRDTIYYQEFDEQLAVHGGVDFKRLLGDNPLELMWNRNFKSGFPLDKVQIIGHTPNETILMTDDRKTVNIDTGAFFTNQLTVIEFDIAERVYTNRSKGYDGQALDLYVPEIK